MQVYLLFRLDELQWNKRQALSRYAKLISRRSAFGVVGALYEEELKMKPIKEMSFMIHSFMIRELGLCGCELIVFAIIYSFTRGAGFFYGTQRYLVDTSGNSVSTVRRALAMLYEKGYIEKCVISGRTGIRVSSFISMPRGAYAENAEPDAAPYDEIAAPYDEINTDSESQRVGRRVDGAHSGAGNKDVDKASLGAGYRMDGTANTGASCNGKDTSAVSCKSIEESLPPNDAELLLPPYERVREEGLDVTEWLTERAPRPKYVFHTFGYEGIVGLTAEQYRRLLRLVDCEKLHVYITKLQTLILDKGYRSFNHYKTLKKWILEDTAV